MVKSLCAWVIAVSLLAADQSPTHDPLKKLGLQLLSGSVQVRDSTIVSGKTGEVWLRQVGLIPPVPRRVEATITPLTGQVPGQWCAAGIAIYADPANYWRLALVEHATDKSNRYFELVEKLDGTWQAQIAPATKLPSEDLVTPGPWQYRQPYRFVLELGNGYIRGRVLQNGSVVFDRRFALPPGAPAVRRGFPALTTVSMRARFEDIRADVRAAPPGPARRGIVVIDNDLPGAERRLRYWAVQALSELDDVKTLKASSIRSAADLNAALVVLPSAEVVSVNLLRAIDSYLRTGGNLMVLSPGQPLEKVLVQVDGQWLPPDDAVAAMARPGPVLFDPAAQPLDKMPCTSNRPDHGASLRLVRTSEVPGSAAAEARVKNFDGWCNWGVTVPSGRLGGEYPCILFWAKGDRATTHLTIELRERDASRWMATVKLTEHWRRYVLRPEDFKFWHDCPARGKRGYPGDQVQPENVEALVFGLARSHSPLGPGPKRFWISAIWAAKLPGKATITVPTLRLDAISPWYKTFRLPSSARLTATGPLSPRERLSARVRGPMRCAYARPWGRCMTGERSRRWIGLLRAQTADGYHAWPAALVVSAKFPYVGCGWSFWGLSLGQLRAGGEALCRLFARVARRQMDGLWLLEAGPDQVAYLRDQPIRVGARVINFSANERTAEVAVRVSQGGRTLKTWRHTVAVPPLQERRVEWPWKPPGEGEFETLVQLRADGKLIDWIRAPFTVFSPRPSAFVRRRGGQFYLGLKPWHPHGVNFWPRWVIGMEPGDYGLYWMHRAFYDPELVEEELEIAESLSITSVSIQPPRRLEDIPPLWDFLLRCKRHGIKVNLFIPVDPRGFDREYVAGLLSQGRLAQFDAIWAYDIAWEPRWGRYEQRCRFDDRWREWLVDQYGSIERAEAEWDFKAPRDQHGRVTGPSDGQLFDEGPWRRFVAAYRRFVDDFLSCGYGRSCRFVRSLDPNHLISNRAGWGGTGNRHTVRFFQFDPLSGAAHLDFISPEAYGMRGVEGDFWRWGFTDAYCRWAGNGKPTFWAEFGASLYPLYSSQRYEWQRLIWENVMRLVVVTGSNGEAGWWWPGGYRVDERSDFGCIEPWGKPRPSALELRRWARRICSPRADHRPVAFIEIDRDKHVCGLAGLWQEHVDEYVALAKAGKRVVLRTAADGLDSVTVPLVCVGNVPYRGAGPLKWLNSELDDVSVQASSSVHRPSEDLLWHEITIRVPAGQQLQVRTRWLNTGVAAWASAETAGGKPGAVRLVEVSSGRTLAALRSGQVPRYGAATFEFSVDALRTGERRKLTLSLEAAGRCRFGQLIHIQLEASR